MYTLRHLCASEAHAWNLVLVTVGLIQAKYSANIRKFICVILNAQAHFVVAFEAFSHSFKHAFSQYSLTHSLTQEGYVISHTHALHIKSHYEKMKKNKMIKTTTKYRTSKSGI